LDFRARAKGLTMKKKSDSNLFSHLQVLENFGGIWGLYGRDIWPKNLVPPYIPISHKGFWQHFLDFFDKLFALLRGGNFKSTIEWGPFPDLAEKIDAVSTGVFPGEHFAVTLARSHQWISERILRYIFPLFSPFWKDIPLQAVTTSERSLVWTLAVYASDTYGPDLVLQAARSKVKRGEKNPLSFNLLLNQKYVLTPDAAPGDFLNLHICIEILVASLKERLNLTPLPASGKRKLGGLRTRQFLDIYSALANPDLSGGQSHRIVGKWPKVIRMLIASSPLTQVVYADVIETVSPQTCYVSLTGFKTEETWHELWISHLAKSMIGFILSPPPCFEKWQDAEERCQQVEAEARQWASRRGYPVNSREIESYPGLREARELCRKLYAEKVRQHAARIAHLAHIFQANSKYLRLRVLDMLVRYIAASSAQDMQKQWREKSRKDPILRARNFLLTEECVYFDSFMEILFGQLQQDSNWENVFGLLDREQVDNLSGSIRDMIDFPIQRDIFQNDREFEDQVEQIAGEAGVRNQSVRQLIRRFADRESWGIMLPFKYPNHQAEAPMTFLVSWGTIILQSLSQRSNEISVKTEIREEYEYQYY
jgi:hypothetical protein